MLNIKRVGNKVKNTGVLIGKTVTKTAINTGHKANFGMKYVLNKTTQLVKKKEQRETKTKTETETDLLGLFDSLNMTETIDLDQIKKKYLYTLAKDDNKVIVENILQRLKKGAVEYKHGMRVNDNTKMYGTKDNSWLEMALEEYLDGILYITSSLIRHKRRMKLENFVKKSDKLTYDDSIIHETKQIIYDKYFQQKNVLMNL